MQNNAIYGSNNNAMEDDKQRRRFAKTIYARASERKRERKKVQTPAKANETSWINDGKRRVESRKKERTKGRAEIARNMYRGRKRERERMKKERIGTRK